MRLFSIVLIFVLFGSSVEQPNISSGARWVKSSIVDSKFPPDRPSLCKNWNIEKLHIGQKTWVMQTTQSSPHMSSLFQSSPIFVTKMMISGRCGARFLLPSGAPSKCEASHSTCCSARGWWASSWRCWWSWPWWSPWWCSRCSSSPEDCMCDDCLYYEWEEVNSLISIHVAKMLWLRADQLPFMDQWESESLEWLPFMGQ